MTCRRFHTTCIWTPILGFAQQGCRDCKSSGGPTDSVLGRPTLEKGWSGPGLSLISLNFLRFQTSEEHLGFFHAMEPAYKDDGGRGKSIHFPRVPPLLQFLETNVWQTKVSWPQGKGISKNELQIWKSFNLWDQRQNGSSDLKQARSACVGPRGAGRSVSQTTRDYCSTLLRFSPTM